MCHIQWPWTTPNPISRSRHYLSLNISEMAKDMVTVAIPGKYETVPRLPNGTIFNDIEWPLTRDITADIRDRRSSMSPLYWHHDTTSAVDSSGYPWWPRLSGGCNACMEQSATRDSGLLLTFDTLEGNQVSPFSSVIRLTWRRLLRWSADVCIALCNSFRSRFL